MFKGVSSKTNFEELVDEINQDIDNIDYLKFQDFDETTLFNFLRYLDDKYSNGLSLIGDNVYDQIVKIYEAKFEPYNLVGALPTKNITKLNYYLGSLDKVKDETQLTKWTNKYSGPYIVQDKVDGNSALLEVSFLNGQRQLSLRTRGDGNIGSDITHYIPYLNLPIDNININMAIRGEIVLPKEEFEKVKNIEGKIYKNGRNLVSGQLGATVSKINQVIANKMVFVAYNILNQTNTPEGDVITLADLGFNTPNPIKLKQITVDNLTEHLNNRKINALYEIDGLVIYNNVYQPYPKDNNPKHIIAFKGIDDSHITEVISVSWNVSRFKILTPIVHFNPIDIDGATIEKATGHNARNILINKIGQGAQISIIRSNGVIPKITSVISPSNLSENELLPNVDQYGQYEWDENKVEIYLLNPNIEVYTEILENFIETLGIKNFGYERCKSLVDNGIITIKDLIDAPLEEFKSIPRFGDTIANNLYNQLHQKITNISLAKLLYASSMFENIGEKTFSKILENQPNLLLNFKNLEIAQLLKSIKGIGQKTIETLLDNLPRFVEWLKPIPQITLENTNSTTLNNNNNSNNNTLQNLTNQNVVFTGFTETNLKKQIELRGGHVDDTIKKNTNILVVKDLSKITGKVKKAQEKGIVIITKEEFIKQYIKETLKSNTPIIISPIINQTFTQQSPKFTPQATLQPPIIITPIINQKFTPQSALQPPKFTLKSTLQSPKFKPQSTFTPTLAPQATLQSTLTPQATFTPPSFTPQATFTPQTTFTPRLEPQPFKQTFTPQATLQSPILTSQATFTPTLTPQATFKQTFTPQATLQSPILTPQATFTPTLTPQATFTSTLAPQATFTPTLAPQATFTSTLAPQPFKQTFTPQTTLQPTTLLPTTFTPTLAPQPFKQTFTPQTT